MANILYGGATVASSCFRCSLDLELIDDTCIMITVRILFGKTGWVTHAMTLVQSSRLYSYFALIIRVLPSAQPVWRNWFWISLYVYDCNRPLASYTKAKIALSAVWCLLTASCLLY
jgi:hypothetical protein